MNGKTMAEQPINLPTAIYLGVFTRAEQRVLQAIFRAIAEDGGGCVRNAISRAVVACWKRPNAAFTALSRFPTF
jgi:hypothetical protein